MAIIHINNLKQNIRSGQCLLGLDFGSKIIGISVSDVFLVIASPLESMQRTHFSRDLVYIKTLISDRNVGAIVIGLPLNLDGKEGPRCQSTRQFAANVLNQIDIPIAFWDERLSTAAVERVLISDVNMSRKRRRNIVDKLAATYILQGALDSIQKF